MAVIPVTEIMRERLIAHRTALPEPTFAVGDSANNTWQQRRPYLGVFVHQPENSPKLVVGLGIAIPGKMGADFERRVTVSDFTIAKPPVSVDGLRARLGTRYEHAIDYGPAASDASARHLLTALRAEAPHLVTRLDESPTDNIGAMFFVRFGPHAGDPIWTADLLAWQRNDAQAIFGHLQADAAAGFPVPFYPLSLQQADAHSRVADLDMDIIEDSLVGAVRELVNPDQHHIVDALRLATQNVAARRYG